MERKTAVNAETGKHYLRISRDFDLPVELLFKAYAEPKLVEQWMGTKVLKLESRKHGGYQFETTDDRGNVVFRAHGAIHEFIPNRRIVRTFEMENALLGVQLEMYEFETLTASTSRLRMRIIYESVEHRDEQLQFPFAHGITMAHDRLQKVMSIV